MKADIVIVGAGIAGLWTLAYLRKLGYDAVLLESRGIGGIQSMASQGIIHSGLKYAFAGKINSLAQSISAMPDIWKKSLKGQGPVDLTSAKVSSPSQLLLIPSGFMGEIIKLVAGKALGGDVKEIEEWPEEIKTSGFKGSVIFMDEPVLNIPSVVRALAEPHRKYIRQVKEDENIASLIEAKTYIYTAAAGNESKALQHGDTLGLEVQKRPLLMGMLKGAPFPLFAHFVGTSEKPVATITTHTGGDGSLIWYIGGGAAERAKESSPTETHDAIVSAFQKYMPNVDTAAMEWATLPIDRIEGKSVDQPMPDTPTIHEAGNSLYCWPTKLTFAPMLAEMIAEWLKKKHIDPSYTSSDFSGLAEVEYASTPWDEAQWTKESLARRA
jgi:hypothetical protein